MLLRKIVTICFCLTLSATAAQADLSDKQPLYRQIADQCGEDPSKPSFSNTAYVEALTDAAKAMKDAQKNGGKSQRDAITKIVERLKECQKAEVRKFEIFPMDNCLAFTLGYEDFSARASDLIRKGLITFDDRLRIRENFRKPAENCVREIIQDCIDPTDTKALDALIKIVRAASEFEFIYSYKNETGVERYITEKNPLKLKFKFCTDTDYSCKGDTTICNNRIAVLKGIMQSYIEK